ncbi:MAG: dihydroorotate oxidase, partial [Saprospiraceae bacterium]|nr:dihydroorotate oxidase [Saprospiraceae bacterium]
MSIDLSTRIGNVQLDTCFYNASGPRCTTKEELHQLGQSQSAAILTKSSTLELREGNPKPRYVENEWGSINSMGLPNKGYLYYTGLIEEMATYNKPYFISVSGLSLDNNLKMLEYLNGLEGISGI